MSKQIAVEEYDLALKKGQKEYRERIMAGKNGYPEVLDALLPEGAADMATDVGLLEIPAQRIVGVKSAGRITAFTAGFLPLLDRQSEFARKWVALCEAHLGPAGIRDPIECYEYLGNFYVQEGNKRVSVLRHFGAARIPGNVKRILPPKSEEPRIRAYYEFLEFYKMSRLYAVQFRRPGDYGKLLAFLNKRKDEPWTKDEQKTFQAYFSYFMEAFSQQDLKGRDILPEEALLLWLKLYPYQDLGRLTAAQLRRSLAELWPDVVSSQERVKVETRAEEGPAPGLLTRITLPDHLHVAFVHQLSPAASPWVMGHEEGRRHLEQVMGDKVVVRSYYDANTPELAQEKIEEAVSDGAQVVFTTSPPLSRATLKAAVKHPRVRFCNCSVDQPYTSVRTYYGRIYEAKFISGAIAGAMANDDRIGYIASYPNFGEPASINAFALGARLTNPRAQIELRWSCLPGTPQADLLADGIRVLSNRDAPTQSKMYLDFCSYGTYLMEDRGDMISLGSPVWLWGRFYEFVIRNILSGGWRNEKGEATALNYWLGMDSGVIDIALSDKLPEGVRQLANFLRAGLAEGRIDPFLRRIVAQDGSVKNDGSRPFTPAQLLKMDWFCDNVLGSIPEFEEILPVSQPLVRELGLYRDRIPTEKETKTRENTDRIR